MDTLYSVIDWLKDKNNLSAVQNLVVIVGMGLTVIGWFAAPYLANTFFEKTNTHPHTINNNVANRDGVIVNIDPKSNNVVTNHFVGLTVEQHEERLAIKGREIAEKLIKAHGEEKRKIEKERDNLKAQLADVKGSYEKLKEESRKRSGTKIGKFQSIINWMGDEKHSRAMQTFVAIAGLGVTVIGWFAVSYLASSSLLR